MSRKPQQHQPDILLPEVSLTISTLIEKSRQQREQGGSGENFGYGSNPLLSGTDRESADDWGRLLIPKRPESANGFMLDWLRGNADQQDFGHTNPAYAIGVTHVNHDGSSNHRPGAIEFELILDQKGENVVDFGTIYDYQTLIVTMRLTTPDAAGRERFLYVAYDQESRLSSDKRTRANYKTAHEFVWEETENGPEHRLIRAYTGMEEFAGVYPKFAAPVDLLATARIYLDQKTPEGDPLTSEYLQQNPVVFSTVS